MATATEKETVMPAEKDGHVPDSSSVKGKVSEKLLKHSHDADAAMKAFEGFEGETIELTEETNKRLLRKIDLHLMPVSKPPLCTNELVFIEEYSTRKPTAVNRLRWSWLPMQ